MLVYGGIVGTMIPYLTVSETARILKVHENSVRRWLHQAVFAGVIRLPGGQYRIPLDALAAMTNEEKRRGR